MASISEDRIREMEEEMNRFEKEISQQTAHSSMPGISQFNNQAHPAIRPVIGAGTYHQVVEQLHLQHPSMNHPPQMMRDPPRANILPPPPCPPNFGNIGMKHRIVIAMVISPAPMAMSGPHQPGPNHLQFIPHQIRAAPGPNMLMRQSNHVNMVPQQNHMGFQSNFNVNSEERSDSKTKSETQTSATISSTPVVISAKPTVYSKNPSKKVAKMLVKEVPIIEKPIVTPVILSTPPITNYNANVTPTISTTLVGPTFYPTPFQISAADDKKKEKKPKKIVRTAGGQVWDDNTLLEWSQDDFRVFCGDLGNDVTDEVLTRTFSKYSSFLKARVVRDKRTNKTRGYGFASFKDPQDFIKAMKELNGKYVGSRPIKLRKSCWKDRNLEVAKKKTKERQKLGLR
ncbi:RNA-binding protein 42 [Nymphon striatum]|nr:RNA-binding protein 42 [Nymphon striatum]